MIRKRKTKNVKKQTNKRRRIRDTIWPEVIASVVLALFLAFYPFTAPARQMKLEQFTVNLDDTQDQVVDKLKAQGYIKSKYVFKLVLELTDHDLRIEPGSYKISKNMHTWDLAKTMLFYQSMKWVVIPEGRRKEEIADVVTCWVIATYGYPLFYWFPHFLAKPVYSV